MSQKRMFSRRAVENLNSVKNHNETLGQFGGSKQKQYNETSVVLVAVLWSRYTNVLSITSIKSPAVGVSVIIFITDIRVIKGTMCDVVS